MKKFIWICLGVIALSCNNAKTPGDASKDSTGAGTTSTATVNYPYKIEHPDYWDMGSSDNTMVVLNALKTWEDGKVDESLKYFADSVQVQFDALDRKISNDSLKTMLGGFRNNFKSVDLKMGDWESVISKDKKEEWVTVWYTQHWETKDGKKDSSSVINDLKLKDGKITRLNEYTRKLH